MDGASGLASSLPQDEIPIKLRCATCNKLAVNAFRLPCCDQSICETCQSSLPSACPVCEHAPLAAEDCKPNKALRTTIRVFLRTEEKKREIARAKQQKAEEAQAEAERVTPAVAEVTASSEVPEKATPAAIQAEGLKLSEPPLDTSGSGVEAGAVPALDTAPETEDVQAGNEEHTTSGNGTNQDGGAEDGTMVQAPGNEDQVSHDQSMNHQLSGQNNQGNGWNGSFTQDQMQMFNGGRFPMNNNNMVNGMSWNEQNGFDPMMMQAMQNGMPNGQWGSFPNMMDMSGQNMDPMAMSQQGMYGGFGGQGMGMNGMGGMNNGMNMGMGGMGFDASGHHGGGTGGGPYDGWNAGGAGQNNPWNTDAGAGQDKFNPNAANAGGGNDFGANSAASGFYPNAGAGSGAAGAAGTPSGPGAGAGAGYNNGNFSHHPQMMNHSQQFHHNQHQLNNDFQDPFFHNPGQAGFNHSNHQQFQRGRGMGVRGAVRGSRGAGGPFGFNNGRGGRGGFGGQPGGFSGTDTFHHQLPMSMQQQQMNQMGQQQPSSVGANFQEATVPDANINVGEVVQSVETGPNGDSTIADPSRATIMTTTSNTQDDAGNSGPEVPRSGSGVASLPAKPPALNKIESVVSSMDDGDEDVAKRETFVAPLGPAALMQGGTSQFQDFPIRGGRGGGVPRGGFRGRGGGFHGMNAHIPTGPSMRPSTDTPSAAAATSMPAPTEPKGQGVIGAPRAPKALREGLPNTGIRGRGGFSILGRGGGHSAAVKSKSRSPGRKESPSRSRTRSGSADKNRSTRHQHRRHRSRSASGETDSDKERRRQLRKRRRDNGDDDRQKRPREASADSSKTVARSRSRTRSLVSSKRSSRRDVREVDQPRTTRVRSRSPRSSRRDRSGDRRRRRHRESQSPKAADTADTVSSRPAKPEPDSRRRRSRDRSRHRHGDARSSRRERHRTRSATAGGNESDHSQSRHRRRHRHRSGRDERERDKTRDRDKERERDPLGPPPPPTKSRDPPTGPAALSGKAQNPQIDIHTLEREARNRERLLKEQQRRDERDRERGDSNTQQSSSTSRKRDRDRDRDRESKTTDHPATEKDDGGEGRDGSKRRRRHGGNEAGRRESGGNSLSRRVSYAYEDGESGEARANRVEKEREAARWG
ncbi:MAG: hypothetical protein M4579_000559 [Chaenotheca gracillima]|nr:MAG: hypothetical protein M4579_000559 [Chaenotheca gracillima]